MTPGLNKYFVPLCPSFCFYGNYSLCLHLLQMHTCFMLLAKPGVQPSCSHIHTQRKSVSRTKQTWKAKPADVTLHVRCQSMLFFWKLCSGNNPWHSLVASTQQPFTCAHSSCSVKAACCWQELWRLRANFLDAINQVSFHYIDISESTKHNDVLPFTF